ncbi:MAG: hypothetical protein MN733_02525 [Nitrososphaera sp.]|nr:hypothetical protein [Nitrososphaera sp.]
MGGWLYANPTCFLIGEFASYLRLDNGSRMSCEVHVRFCEGLGVRLHRATHPYMPLARGQDRVAPGRGVAARGDSVPARLGDLQHRPRQPVHRGTAQPWDAVEPWAAKRAGRSARLYFDAVYYRRQIGKLAA